MEGIHTVIKGALHDVGVPLWLDTPGFVAVRHAKGLVQKERPHIHCWIPGERKVDCGKTYNEQKAANGCCHKHVTRRDYSKFRPDLPWNTHGNSYYTHKEHDSFQKWLEYVLRDPGCKEPELLVWNRPEPPPHIEPPRPLDELIVPATVVETPIPVVKEKKKDPAYKRFEAYCSEVENPDIDEVIDHWTYWTQGNYEMQRVQGPIRYVYYTKTTDPIQKERIRDTMRREIRDRFFSHY